MLIIPAIDLRGGRCVRLSQGRFEAEIDYGDPFERIRAFARAGAEWVHVVDLDGAKAGLPAQHGLVGRLARETGAFVQCGGGVRSRADVKALLDAGAARVVVGSLAVRQPDIVRSWIAEFGAERVCCAFDVRAAAGAYEVATSGWLQPGGATLDAALAEFPAGALRHILVTDIARDGELSGPNVALMRDIARARADLRLQASGGVASLADLAALKAAGAAAAIVGRAFYEDAFTLEAARAG
jgi:phosphoribosylformimino-5-aminoimidazole carboxamide ribotide isomerase